MKGSLNHPKRSQRIARCVLFRRSFGSVFCSFGRALKQCSALWRLRDSLFLSFFAESQSFKEKCTNNFGCQPKRNINSHQKVQRYKDCSINVCLISLCLNLLSGTFLIKKAC